ncbi:cytochrome d ubiquinol oxidase subunit II [Methylovirgula ligni]|uniref:Cytochrome bd-I ubiquinol oxidase subunit 2 apoprotein n=1 Tax=Methylovirgula ligni TaxID=569860 RepID=A0A3D9Z5A1_9HYPH|nr:cytochrome d ubiquinol oxidase subunit II [Methylovirgula ligni]QAY95277.1 cytochrome d ubiquinol oxidase subunit II [Methylovirgula ligni]REF89420.1 cytochrome bd-I ubiquinol oxidase subunit 2 apoprotein [Methylovirgula ligni]
MSYLTYEHLRIIWWLLLGVLLIGFAIADGFDLGTAILLPFVGKTDGERRVVINTVGPVWEGNQVWLILGGGAIFAAWPLVYAVSFSGFYLAMLLVLCALILRPAGFKYRSKLENTRWRETWDWLLFVGGFIPALIFGVAVGNALLGAPFTFDDTMRMTYHGNLFGLLTPFALLCGLVSVAMLTMHGGTWLAVKTEGVVAERARSATTYAGLALIVLFALGGLWVKYLDGYQIVGTIAHDAASNPLAKTVVRKSGQWLANYSAQPWTLLAPILGFGGAALAILATRAKFAIGAFIASSLAVAGVVATAGLSLFPFILPSSSDPSASLTVWDASSSQTTLFIMLIAALIFVPIILAYTSFIYYVLRGKVTEEQVKADHFSY